MLRVRTAGSPERQEFRDYLRGAMDRAGIATAADLARLSGLNRSVIGRWLDGTMKPDLRSLRRVAGPLRVPAIRLFIAAGHVSDEEVELPPEEAPEPIYAEDLIKAEFARKPDILRMVLAAIDAARASTATPTGQSRRRAG